MCGIIGYTGKQNALPILLNGLEALEYRGYDSTGVAVLKNGLNVVKTKGRLSLLREKLKHATHLEGATCGIGHTRWATHGEPCEANAHPHVTKHLALVHNGIIENEGEIKSFLKERGYTFASQTDSEAAAKLIDYYYEQTKNAQAAIFQATCKLRGSYTFGICFAKEPHRIYAICHDSPLIVASSKNGSLVASDVSAILAHTNTYYRPEKDVLAVLEGGDVSFYNRQGQRITQPKETASQSIEQAQKGDFPHFMLKEIHEQPHAISRTVVAHLKDGLPFFGPAVPDGILLKCNAIHIVACGTAMHAGLMGKRIIEKLCRIPVHVEIASEFRYHTPILDKNDPVILLSQSGETADTLAALRHAKESGAYTLAIVNVVGSVIAREADGVLYTPAGPEIAVASTKAYSTQCAMLSLLSLRLAMLRGKISTETVRKKCQKMLFEVPNSVREVLELQEKIRACAKQLAFAEHVFYIGRGIDYDLCKEASLKLKEISYIHSEAYAAGELKHGTISLITKGTPVVALCTERALAEKMLAAIREVAARGASVLCITTKELAATYDPPCDHCITLPSCDTDLPPFPLACATQLLAYDVSDLKGLDVDKPRNLAKSVTVE